MCMDPFVIKLIQGLVLNVVAKVHVNGLVTESFPLERGIRQDYPLSPSYLFYLHSPWYGFWKTWEGEGSWLALGSTGMSIFCIRFLLMTWGSFSKTCRGSLSRLWELFVCLSKLQGCAKTLGNVSSSLSPTNSTRVMYQNGMQDSIGSWNYYVLGLLDWV